MMRFSVKTVRAVLLCVALAGISQLVFGQAFPSKPIRVIVPFAAGGLVEIMARTVSQPVSAVLGYPIIVETRPGGNTFIGMQACKDAVPDGHTFCVTTPESFSYNPWLFKTLPYDVEKDFAAITNLAFPNNVIVASTQAPFNTFEQMISYAKANPGKVNFGTSGVASTGSLYLTAMSQAFDVKMLNVAYKGQGQVFPALLSGEIDVTVGGVGLAMSLIKAGKLKPLAISPFASSVLPGVPAMKDTGGEPQAKIYFGMFAPARTPMPVQEKISSEFAKALRTPGIQEFLNNQSLVPVGSTPAEFAAFVRADREAAGRLFKQMGVIPQD